MPVESVPSRILGAHGLKLCGFGESGSHSLPRITHHDGGVEAFHVRTQVINGVALIAVKMSVVLTLGSSFLPKLGEKVSKMTLKEK